MSEVETSGSITSTGIFILMDLSPVASKAVSFSSNRSTRSFSFNTIPVKYGLNS